MTLNKTALLLAIFFAGTTLAQDPAEPGAMGGVTMIPDHADQPFAPVAARAIIVKHGGIETA